MSTLAELRERLRLALRDTAAAEWSDDELAAHLRRALHALSLARPLPHVALLETTAGLYTVSLATVPGLIAVRTVTYPCDLAAPAPVPAPEAPRWRLRDATTLELLLPDPPRGDGTDDVLIEADVAHRIAGLDGAAATTLSPAEEEILLTGASAAAIEQLALSLVGQVTVGDAPARYAALAAERRAEFARALEALRQRERVVADPRVAWDGEV